MKLTKVMRERIALAVVEHALKGDTTTMLEREHDLAMRVYCHRYPASVRAAMSAMIEAVEASGMKVSGGKSPSTFDKQGGCAARIDGQHHNLQLATQMPRINHYRYFTDGENIEADSVIGNDVLKFAADREALAVRQRTMLADVEGTIARLGTDTKLAAEWPNIMSIAQPIIDHLAPPSTPLAKLNIGQLDAMLDLPAPVADNDAADAKAVAA